MFKACVATRDFVELSRSVTAPTTFSHSIVWGCSILMARRKRHSGIRSTVHYGQRKRLRLWLELWRRGGPRGPSCSDLHPAVVEARCTAVRWPVAEAAAGAITLEPATERLPAEHHLSHQTCAGIIANVSCHFSVGCSYPEDPLSASGISVETRSSNRPLAYWWKRSRGLPYR